MKRWMVLFGLVALVFVSPTPGVVAAIVSDDFEDGSVDSSQWLTGGRRVSWTAGGEGPWTWSTYETRDAGDPDGYLGLNVLRSTLNINQSFGALAWAQTKYNFNDGQSHTTNFTWKYSNDSDGGGNFFLVHITDGYLPTFQEANWYPQFLSSSFLPVGTKALLWDEAVQPQPWRQYFSDLPKQTWSITIAPSGVARLYDGADGTGSLIHESTLDTDKPWYLRFMAMDASASGDASESNTLKLYSVHDSVPEPSTLIIWSLLATLAMGVGWWRKRKLAVSLLLFSAVLLACVSNAQGSIYTMANYTDDQGPWLVMGTITTNGNTSEITSVA